MKMENETNCTHFYNSTDCYGIAINPMHEQPYIDLHYAWTFEKGS